MDFCGLQFFIQTMKSLNYSILKLNVLTLLCIILIDLWVLPGTSHWAKFITFDVLIS